MNADGYLTTGQGVLSYNMFAYCGNNPVNRADPTGLFWKEIGDFFSNVWNGVCTWAQNTFGVGSSTTTTIAEYETPIIPAPSPITVTAGSNTTQTISETGDCGKPISAYANKDAENPIMSSSVGININISDATLALSLGFDDIGIYGSWTSGNDTTSLGIKANLSEMKLGCEYSMSYQWDTTTVTDYVNCSVDGWAIVAVYGWVTTGQPISSPSKSYAY